MSNFKLTESQQLFVDSLDKNTLVSASAGSGKTSTMIAKLTKMIVEQRIPLKNLLVVTYTNSAASEMKQKLFNSLVKEMQSFDNEEQISYISEQMRLDMEGQIHVCILGMLLLLLGHFSCV